MEYLGKLSIGKNKTSYKRRRITIGPKDKVNGAMYYKLYKKVSLNNDIYALFGMESKASLELEKCCLERFHTAYLYHENKHEILPKGTRVPVCKTISAALKNCKTDGQAEFEHKFFFTVSEMKILASKLFGEKLYDLGNHRGKVSNQELLLILCARYRHVLATVQDIGDWFGRDKSFVSASFHLGIKLINEKYSSLLDLNKLSQWSDRNESWNEAYRTKYSGRINSELYGRFESVSSAMDGVRLYTARPLKDMVQVANPYCGNEANILFLGIVAPNGIMIGLTRPYCGRNNDTGVALAENLEMKLETANMNVVCDSIFGHTSRIKPIPRQNQTHPFTKTELKSISALRVSVEWSFGETVTKLPFLVQVWKMQLNATSPARVFKVGILLSNFIRTFRGCNANTYFGVEAMDLDEYLQMAVELDPGEDEEDEG